jgi:opacity protein-like surface antigen
MASARSIIDKPGRLFAGLLLAVLSIGLAPCSPALAQDPGPINTERPSFSSSPLALPAGFWQIEAGYEYTRTTGSNGSKEHTLPNALLRWGFHPRFELQFDWTGYSWMTASGKETNGFKDLSVGVKWQLQDGSAPFLAGLFAGLSLPVGDEELTSDDYDPELGFFWTYAGSLDWFGTVKLTESANKYKLENAIGISFSPTPNTSTYVEYKGSFPDGQGPAHDLNFALMHLLANDLQVDLNSTIGLNKRASDYTLGLGIAYRF